METEHSPEILDRWKTSDIPRLHLRHIVKVKKRDQHSVASLSQWMVSGGITEPVTIQMVSLRRWLPAGGFTGQWVPTDGITKLVSAYWQAGECLLVVSPSWWVPTGGIIKPVSAYWRYHQAGECLLAVSLVNECLHHWVSKWLLVESVSNYWQCHQVATGDVTVSEWLVVMSQSVSG